MEIFQSFAHYARAICFRLRVRSYLISTTSSGCSSGHRTQRTLHFIHDFIIYWKSPHDSESMKMIAQKKVIETWWFVTPAASHENAAYIVAMKEKHTSPIVLKDSGWLSVSQLAYQAYRIIGRNTSAESWLWVRDMGPMMLFRSLMLMSSSSSSTRSYNRRRVTFICLLKKTSSGWIWSVVFFGISSLVHPGIWSYYPFPYGGPPQQSEMSRNFLCFPSDGRRTLSRQYSTKDVVSFPELLQVITTFDALKRCARILSLRRPVGSFRPR